MPMWQRKLRAARTRGGRRRSRSRGLSLGAPNKRSDGGSGHGDAVISSPPGNRLTEATRPGQPGRLHCPKFGGIRATEVVIRTRPLSRRDERAGHEANAGRIRNCGISISAGRRSAGRRPPPAKPSRPKHRARRACRAGFSHGDQPARCSSGAGAFSRPEASARRRAAGLRA